MDIRALAYAVIGSSEPGAWARFGEDVLGLMACDAGFGLALKMDERAGRIFVQPHESDRYLATGWELADVAAFDAARATLGRHGVTVERATVAERALRGVQDMIWFRDPSGNRHELALGYVSDFRRFVSPQGVPRFVTGGLGFGHVVLPAPRFMETDRFLAGMMGFGLADRLVHRPAGHSDATGQRIHFLHCGNGRHHSVALFEGAVPAGCVHLMIEVETMDEVGRAFDRMLHHDVPMMATLGRHVNDEMISFYMASPGGFAIEFGHGGRIVDWDRHTVFESTAVSHWGHDFGLGLAQAADRASIAA